MGKLKLAVFFSGGGSTLQNLIDHIRNGTLDADINWTLSSRAGVDGIRKSEEAGIPCLVVPRKEFDSHKSFSEKINEHLRDNPVDLIVLAGFMSLYHFPPEYNRRVVNIHPALIPAFCGLGMYGHHVHEAVIQSGVSAAGSAITAGCGAGSTGERMARPRAGAATGGPATGAGRNDQAGSGSA